MKSYKANECDFHILNLLNEYNPDSLCASIMQDAEERAAKFGDEMNVCIELAQVFSNAVITSTARRMAANKLIEEITDKPSDLPYNDFKLLPKGREEWATVSRQLSENIQRPGWTKSF